VHGDYCANCGRFSSLPPGAHTELSEIDVRCERGAEPHDHAGEERAQRVDRFFASISSKR
jgi:hypothetical protein